MRRLLEKILHLPSALPDSVRTTEVVEFLGQKALWPYLRGFFYRLRFKSCGRMLFIGKGFQVFFPRYISLGNNVFIGRYCSINGLSREGVKIGNRVRIREFSWIQVTSELHQPGTGITIGDRTYVGPYCYLGAGGGLAIGQDVLIGGFVQFLAENHHFSDPSIPIRVQGVSRKGICVGDDVWIGNNAIILDGISIGKGSVVGAGSIVTHDVAPFSVVAGNPARLIRKRE